MAIDYRFIKISWLLGLISNDYCTISDLLTNRKMMMIRVLLTKILPISMIHSVDPSPLHRILRLVQKCMFV